MHRSRSILPRAFVVSLLATALGLAVAGPALAADPTPTPSPAASTGPNVIVYSGTLDVVFKDSDGVVSNESGTRAFTISVDCSGRPCMISLFLPAPFAIKNGRFAASNPASGDPCDTAHPYRGAVELTGTVTKTDITMHATVAGSGVRQCADSPNSTAAVDSGVYDFSGTPSSGRVCLLDASCESAAPASGSGANDHRPRVASTPSVLSTLPTTARAVTVRNSLWAVAAAVILVLLIALPTQLFNSASEKASERLGAWWKRRRSSSSAGKAGTDPAAGPAAGPAAAKSAVAWSGWPLAAAGVLAASVISALVDPHLAFDAAGLRTVLSILVSFVIEVVLGWLVLLLIVRRTHPGTVATFQFKPLTLVVVAAAVLLTRITGFQPGIVFGLVAGVVFGGVIGTAKARVALIGLGYGFAVGILAWIGYSIIATSAPHPNAVLVFAQETLSSAAIAGIAALPIALLPIGALVGREVWQWNKIVWAVAYAIGLIGFFLVLMPMPFSWQAVPLSLWTWIALYLVYALVATAVWLAVTRPWRKEPAAAT
ncbi:MAG: hypothetical protein ABIP33_06180 [Pseudolysinimonas sp.]